jgi:hypothetical protein
MTRAEEPEKWPGLELAIEGTNLSPADVPVRQLVELLEAATAALDAIAEERGGKIPQLRLLEVRNGSAAYELRVPDGVAAPIFEELAQHIKMRGAQSSPQIRRALDRLHRAGKTGSVRVRVYDAKGKARGKPLHVAPPVEIVEAPFETASEVFGRIVAVSAGRGDKLSVRLRLDDGGTSEFTADRDVAAVAGRLFLRTVRADVDYEVTSDGETANQITAIEPFEAVADHEILDAFERTRAELADAGIKIRASDWLKELDE